MKFTLDKFNGLIIDSLSIPENESEFNNHLTEITNFAINENKNLIWLTIPIEKSHLVKTATNLGFVFHNCLETELTLIRKSETTTFIPFIPTHTIGAGAIVINACDEILVIKEHRQKGYKLPGGHIELGECIESAIIREVFEETGIEASFDSIVGFTAIHPSYFGRSNLYFVCRLNPVSETIEIQDLEEIADAKWISITDYVNDINNASFNRQMVHSLAKSVGLSLVDLKYNNVPHKKQETFFVQPYKNLKLDGTPCRPLSQSYVFNGVMMNIVNEVKSQFARVLISSDWKNLLDVADYHFEEAAKLKKKDIRFTKNKLLIRNSMKRLHLGIGVELALKAAFLKQNICVNTFKKPAITDEFKNTPTHNFNEFDPDLINPNDTFTMGSLIDKFSATLGFEVSEDFLNGLRIAMTFRNKEGHCSFPEHQFDPENYKMIENSVTQLYFMAFNQELTFSIAMTKDDKGKFSKT